MAAWFKFSFSFVWWKMWLFACEGPAGWLPSCSRFNGHVTLNIIFIFWFLSDKIEQNFLVFRFLVTNFLIELQDCLGFVHWSSVAVSPQWLSCAEHLTILFTFLIFSADNVNLQIWPGKHRKESPLKKMHERQTINNCIVSEGVTKFMFANNQFAENSVEFPPLLILSGLFIQSR